MPLAMAQTFSADAQKDFFVDRDDRELMVRARLKPGTTRRQAHNELAVLARDFEREYPKTNRDRGAAVRTMYEMRTQASDANWKFGVIFTMLALVVLLVACTNAAGLLLSRARTRTREIAVRLAIGAGRFRLIRLLLTESLVLALLGGLGGIAIGYVGIHFLGKFRIPAELPVKIPFRMDTRVLLASLAFSVLSALICGLAPALQSTRLDLVNGLKSLRRRRARGRTQAPVGPQRARRGADRHVADAARRVVPDVPGLPAQPERGTGVRGAGQGSRAHGAVRPASGAVRRGPDGGVLQAARRARARGSRSPERGFTQNPPLGLGDFGRIAFVPEGFQMPRDRESFTVADGHGRRGVLRDDGHPDPARPRLPCLR